ncbi:uncharacterized protein LOC120273607 [Dioscorea cayenensis subsp. rotundata]|uniref:Uncharacterized protein LOC120273607 n=1 Tax=Dioscorea cayennensis subsp. rotundata TaxID=55577 RepID=A0AB40C8L5_DIOCR|nr:uncharacterized protein LOC120273607 [Dioscorea cayenensis subsp. rotundata]
MNRFSRKSLVWFRIFLFKGGNGKGIHAVNWRSITDNKSEGGLGHRNLSFAKSSLMSKNVFKYLNSDNIFWVDIASHKYGHLNFWVNSIPAICSWIFRGICRTASNLKHNLWIKSFNPAQTSILFDPWLFEIPIAFKPTYLNVNTDLSDTCLSDFFVNDLWNVDKLYITFGDFLGPLVPNICNFDLANTNFWVWKPHSSNLNISSAVYNHLNHNHDLALEWPGWNKLWKLHVAPRIMHFIWLMLHGRVSTTDFLNSINIGPITLCVFCHIDCESSEHLFLECRCAQMVWNLLNHKLGINISFPDLISAGFWITDYNYSIHTIFVIATSIWYLWKARCEAIFNNIIPNFTNISVKAIAHVKDFMQENASLVGRKLLLNNFSTSSGSFLFFAHRWIDSSNIGKLGFFISSHTYRVSCVGCCSFSMDSHLQAGLKALCIAVQSSLDRQLVVRSILHSSYDLPQSLKSDRNPVAWRAAQDISSVTHLLQLAGNPTLVAIPARWNGPASALASVGSNNHTLSLFLSGRDLPRWLMDLFF